MTAGPRARYREQVRDEVRAHAWEQIVEAGASALSLKAIAKKMGMTAPALYRYFASRDELLTELVLTAYQDLAEVVEAVPVDAAPETTLRLLAEALRDWASTNPQRYLLVYGTPVPGYSAPPDATDLARRIFTPLVTAYTDLLGSPEAAFGRSVTFWSRLHGVLSLELAGHFAGMGVDTGALYDAEIRSVTGKA
ncbi:TetR/AcrR family transcriptional regulator [Umezawaea sp. Da 62-37]|uniref:TetR/AcrR family transcriptional regulator n=1 Tax=Umezawaea sp. Da 62-37 TaxID=3075927 RepID=UPI0028F6E09F|nr:TetR/AcrR family transcriptional regulator [Umezawaea sp. Da 62-37]WNV88397.1 TetR/AcrR family transcriptional regulator [Umezawaea sp. Da 62-37]